MFIANFPLKTWVQKLLVNLSKIIDFPYMHPVRELEKIALADSVDYIQKKMAHAMGLETAREVLDYALTQAKVDGAILEFGVFKGSTLRYIASKAKNKKVHGFDSFEGLPKAWTGSTADFSVKGKLPRVPGNVTLHQGYFDQTLPQWVSQNKGPVSFLHVDCDLYSSTKTIFDELAPRMVSGTIIVFDEYFNYPNWRQHEFKAFQEFVEANRIKYEYLCYARLQVAVRIVDAPTP